MCTLSVLCLPSFTLTLSETNEHAQVALTLVVGGMLWRRYDSRLREVQWSKLPVIKQVRVLEQNGMVMHGYVLLSKLLVLKQALFACP